MASFIHVLAIERLLFARPSRQSGDFGFIMPEYRDGKGSTQNTGWWPPKGEREE